MRTRAEVDPELHILRSTAASIDDPGARHALECARFKLYSAFERQDTEEAERWARAMRAALLIVDSDKLRELALQALDKIEDAIDS